MLFKNCRSNILGCWAQLLVISAVFALTACGDGGSNDTGGGNTQPSTDSFTVGGNTSGLTSSGLVLQNNGANNLAISADGDFSFSNALATGSSYSVTVATQPSGQTCSVTNGTGTINGSNVTDVQVSCSVLTYSVGGTVAGLTGSGLVLQNNGGDNLAVSANGDFTFATALANGAGYSVSVATQPTGQSCSVINGTGTINGANITNVQVDCITPLPQLWLSANNGVTGFELYRSDGTAVGTTLIKDINLSGNSNPGSLDTFSAGNNLTVMNGAGYFAAADGMHGVELWKSDGTANGTVLVKDINTGPSSSNPRSLVVMGDLLYFVATDATHGAELWKSDGTDAGTALVKDITAGTAGNGPSYLTSSGGTLYFTAFESATGNELWKSDGTLAGTVLVKDIYTGPNGSNPGPYVALGNAVYFSAYDVATGFELWKSDGTAGGTVLFKDITPGVNATTGAYGGYPQFLTPAGGVFYFTANNVPQTGNFIVFNGTQLWKSDGTPTGTVMLKDLSPPATGGGSYPSNLTVVGNTLYFTGWDAINGTELWKSDGTAMGTVLVEDIKAGAGDSSPYYLTAVGSTVYFTADNGTTGAELWKSDGTMLGTVLVKDINPGMTGSTLKSPLAAVGGTLYFTANDGTTGFELWKSNGTEAGTVNVIDLIPGSTNGVNGILKP